MDEYIPQPERPIDQPFLMPIEDVFSISGRGTVVTGRVERGIVKVGETVEIIGIRRPSTTTVTGVEMFRKLLDQGQAGDNIGALLRGIEREGIERGQVLAKPGSVTPHTNFMAEAYILTKDEGGRHTPFFTNYRPQFYFRTTDVTGIVKLPEGTEMVMPGDNVSMRSRADRSDRDGREAALRHPRRRPHRRRRRRRKDHQVSKRTGSKDDTHAKSKYPHQAEGLRSPDSRQFDAGDRQHGQAHRRAGAGSHSAAHRHRAFHREPFRRMSTRRAASSSKSGRTSVCSTSSTPPRRPSTR